MENLSRHHIDGTTPILLNLYGRRQVTDPQYRFKVIAREQRPQARRHGADDD